MLPKDDIEMLESWPST